MKTSHGLRSAPLDTGTTSYHITALIHTRCILIPLFLIATFCSAYPQLESSNKASKITSSWASHGGKMIMRGSYQLNQGWTTSSSHQRLDKYWQGGFYLPEDKRVYRAWKPHVKNAVAPDHGIFTVKGPGVVVTCTRRKSAKLVLTDITDPEQPRAFLPKFHDTHYWGKRWLTSGSSIDIRDKLARLSGHGQILPDKTVTLKVSVHADSYNNRINTGELSWRAPQEMNYEIWYFPRKQGKLININKLHQNNVTDDTDDTNDPDDPGKKGDHDEPKKPSKPNKPEVTDTDDEGLSPIADSHVYSYAYRNWNHCNWGAYQILGAGFNPVGGDKRTYLKFDVRNLNISPSKRIMLRLYHNHTGGSHTSTLGVYQVTKPWKEGKGTYHSGSIEPNAGPGELSWVQQPPMNPRLFAKFNPGPGTNKYIKVDVTDLVRAWKAGKPNHGMVIAPIKTEGGPPRESMFGFYAREHKDAAKRPALVVNGGTIDPPPPTGALQVRAGNKKIKKVTTFYVPVWLDFPKTFPRTRDGRVNVANLNVEISYNPNVLKAGTKILPGNALDKALFQANAQRPGLIKLGFASKQGVQTTGTLAQLIFQAVGQPGQQSPLTVKITTANDSKGRRPQVRVSHGYIDILKEGVTGDYNGNGIIDASDALAALKMSVGLLPQDMILNVDKKDQVTSNDARMLLQMAVQGGKTVPTNTAPTTTKKPVNTTPPITSNPDVAKITSAEARTAYQEYIAAYNKMTSLMARGQGDTPAAQKAYTQYKIAKDRYEAAIKK